MSSCLLKSSTKRSALVIECSQLFIRAKRSDASWSLIAYSRHFWVKKLYQTLKYLKTWYVSPSAISLLTIDPHLAFPEFWFWITSSTTTPGGKLTVSILRFRLTLALTLTFYKGVCKIFSYNGLIVVSHITSIDRNFFFSSKLKATHWKLLSPRTNSKLLSSAAFFSLE